MIINVDFQHLQILTSPIVQVKFWQDQFILKYLPPLI